MRIQSSAAVAAFLLCAVSTGTPERHSFVALTTAQVTDAQVVSSTFTPSLAGAWTAAPDEMPLTSSFDESVWGPNAKSVRTVELDLRSSGEGTLTVTRKVLDARGRTVPASTSIEEARLVVGGARKTVSTRIEHDVKVVSAARIYPDDPGAKWNLAGLKVEVVTFEDGDRNTLEIRFDTPEGRGSFWETLRRAAPGRPKT